jgi:hypothetical protein
MQRSQCIITLKIHNSKDYLRNSNLSNSPLFLQGSGAVPMNVVQMKNVQGANFFDGFLKGFLIGTRAVFDDAYDIEYVNSPNLTL